MTMPTRYPVWEPSVVQGVADVLGATDTGLTGTEIGRLLAELRIPDPGSGITKRVRLGHALNSKQAADNASNFVIRFIREAMRPVRYIEDPGLRTLRQDALNEVLVFAGVRVLDDGRLGSGPRAETLSAAAEHANSLRAELRRRGTHPDVLRYCRDEILTRNAFHAQLEASKSVFDKLRDRTGLTGDGAALVDAALSLAKTGTPLLAINNLSTQTERDEQTGLANLIKGLSGMFRNPVAHDPRIARAVTDDELLELLTTWSMIHRRLDAATSTQGRVSFPPTARSRTRLRRRPGAPPQRSPAMIRVRWPPGSWVAGTLVSACERIRCRRGASRRPT